MKKTLVVLLILAVAGGVFAQEWSWDGTVRLGADVNFSPSPVTIQHTGDDDMGRGEVNLNYSNGGFHAGLNFGVYYDSAPGGVIGASAGYDGENFSINAGMDILTSSFGIAQVNSLWGKWFLFEKQLEILAAYKGPETIYWRATDMLDDNDWDNMDGNNGLEINFTPSFLEGFSVGFAFPDIFALGAGTNFANVFTPFTVGAKYAHDVFTVGLMFTNDAGKTFGKAIYLGGSFNIGDTMSAGAEVILGNFEAADLSLGIAACFNYASDRLGAGGTVTFKTSFASGSNSDLAIKPYVQYAIIEETLLARLDLEVKLGFGSATTFGLWVTPAAYYNPDASGISDDPAHALYLKCALGADNFDTDDFGVKLTFGYRWAF